MTLFETVPKIYHGIAADFREVYGMELDIVSLPVCLRFGSWIGGDRDGNPFVTPSCTREALELARAMVLSHYIQELSLLVRRLTVSTHQVPASEELCARLERYEQSLTEPVEELSRTPQSEAYRRLMLLMGVRLSFTRDQRTNSGAYASAADCVRAVAGDWRRECSIHSSARCVPSGFACTRSTSDNTRVYIARRSLR